MHIPKKWPARGRRDGTSERCTTWGPTVFDRLTPRERSIFDILLKHRGFWISRDRIMDVVWSEADDPPLYSNISIHVSHMRKKVIGTSYIIDSKYGFGYRLRSVFRNEESAGSDEAPNPRRRP
jgi:DNA-binding response OmpR family regulator